MHIEQAVPAQLEALLALYRQARNFMRTTGNPDQWGTTYPEAELVRADIAAGHQYVCMEDGQILATFFYARGDDPT